MKYLDCTCIPEFRYRGYAIKRLWIIITLLCLAGLIVLILSLCLQPNSVCSTPKCAKVAQQILAKLDSSVNPCDDFYKFACGQFTKNTVLGDNAMVSAFTEMSDRLERQLKTLLEQPITKTDRKYEMLAKSLYQGCMNDTAIERESVPFLNRTLKSFGGWPLVEGTNWNESNANWTDIVYGFRKIGINVATFIKFGLTVNSRLLRPRVLFLDQPPNNGLDLNFLTGFDDPVTKVYYDICVEVAVMLGADEKTAKKEMRDVIELDKVLVNIKFGFKYLQNYAAKQNPMYIRELIQKYPNIPWLEYLNLLLGPNGNLNLSSFVVVTVPKYYDNLNTVLHNTKKRTLINYLFKNAVISLLPYLDKDSRGLNNQFSKVYLGKSKPNPRWMDCVVVAKDLNIALSALYVNNFFDRNSKESVSEMVNNIRNQFMETVKTLSWMDDNTKLLAQAKAMSMIDYVGYPDQLLDKNKIDEYYVNLTMDPTKYLESYLNLSKFDNINTFLALKVPVSETDWLRHSKATEIEAYYQRQENSMDLPAAILQDPMFDKDRPQYLNYGAMGFIIGHEVTHGFDSLGSQMNRLGGLQNWWQPQTKKAFDVKAQQFIDLYGSLYVKHVKLKVNGLNTQAENIADHGGFKHAYLAYKNWTKEHGPEPNLPGLPYKPEQLFWIAAAQPWCRVVKDEYLKLIVQSNYHAPSYFRINIPYRNSEYFTKDFNCPSGSSMNAADKVGIW